MDDLTRTMGDDDSPSSSDAASPRRWGNFDLIEKVGQGGFGEVYRAFDHSLQREVALKLLKPSSPGSTGEASSVLREARQLAKVRHPNVVAVHGVEQHGGRVGFWSDFVKGRTLSALLAVQGPFSAREAAGVVIDLARAVSAVHAAGLIHRDIKTSNAMREVGGRILLIDFGLSHSHAEDAHSGGTLTYMAPELFAGGKPSVASDIYALGVVLFHLLTAKYLYEDYPPPAGAAPRRLLDERPDLPERLAAVVDAATHADPARRYQTAAEFIAALSESVAGLPSSAPPRRRRPIWQWAVPGAALLLAAAWFAFLRPASIHSPAGGAHATYAQAKDFIDHYYRSAALDQAIPLFEKTIAQDPQFALAHAGLARAHFLRYWRNRDPKHIQPALDAASKALAIDRNLASVHVTLGRLYTETAKLDLAAQELNEALRLDPRNAEAHHGLAELYYRQGRLADVEPELRKAIDLAPDDWRFHDELSGLYSRTGRMAEALAAQQEAVRLSPDNPRAMSNLGYALRRNGRTREAVDAYRKSIAIEPGYVSYSNLGVALTEIGQFAEAVEVHRKAVELNPRTHLSWGNLAVALSQIPGREAEAAQPLQKAIALAEELRQNDPGSGILLVTLALYYSRVGDANRSLPLLRQAVALVPDDPEILFRGAQAYELLHRRQEASQFLLRALEKGLSPAAVRGNPYLAKLRADSQFAQLAGKYFTNP
jgi:eukaryotic-like serine/threonine-protein kinase